MTTKIRWAPRVPMAWLHELYQRDAAGIIDEELIEKVGCRLYERCQDCIAVNRSMMGDPVCPVCRVAPEVRGQGEGRSLRCHSCGWTSTWTDFHRSWRHLELAGPRELHAEFLESWDQARTPKQKMLAIDRIIHRWHREEGQDDPRGIGRPLGVNLIEGSRKQVIEFLDRLSAGPNHDNWKRVRADVERRTSEWRGR